MLIELLVHPKRRPIIPYRVKLKHRIEYKRRRGKRLLYSKRYVRRPITKLRNRIRSKVRKRLGRRAKRFRLYVR